MEERQAKDGTIYQQIGPDEWQPITRKSKDGTVFTKVGADEWRPSEQQKTSGPSWAMSAVRKGLQGATSGLSDEIAGGSEAAFRAIGIKGASGPLNKMSLEMPSVEGIKQGYTQARDKERANLKLDQETNPKISMASEITGGLVNPLNKATQGAGIVKQAAVLGGAQGFGSSEASNLADLSMDAGKGVLLGAAIGKGADKLSKAIAPAANKLSQSIANKISPAVPKASQSEIIAAADRLGLKVTPAMLDETGFVERLEQTLANSPSFLGQRISKAQKNAYETLQGAVADATKEATQLSEFQLGERVKSGITAKVGERLDPIQTVFEKVKESTKFIPVDPKSKERILNNISKTDEFVLTGGKGKAQDYSDMLGRVENADQLKSMMTLLGKDIAAAQGAEQQVLIAMKNKLANLENNSITRAAINEAKAGGMNKSTGQKIGADIVSELKDARKNYRQLSSDLSETSMDSRLGKNYGPTNFLDKVENLPSENMQQRFFNPDNQRQLQNLAKNFPEELELLRQGKLRDINLASEGQRGETSVQKFLTEIDKLSDESKALIFKDQGQLLGDVKTLNNAMPRNFNPSGTGSQMNWNEALYRNIKDIPTYMLYKGASSNLGKAVGKSMQDGVGAEVRQLGAEGTKALSAPIARAEGGLFNTSKITERVAEDQAGGDVSKSEVKGFDRFAAQGAEKLNKAANDPIIASYLEKIKNTPEGQQWLINSSMKDDPKQVQEIINSIKTSDFYKQELEKNTQRVPAKEPSAKIERPAIKFPKSLRKNGTVVTVENLNDYREAINEGWV